MLFEVLDAGESDPAGGTLEGSSWSLDAGPVRWANVEVVRILDVLQPGDKEKNRCSRHITSHHRKWRQTHAFSATDRKTINRREKPPFLRPTFCSFWKSTLELVYLNWYSTAFARTDLKQHNRLIIFTVSFLNPAKISKVSIMRSKKVGKETATLHWLR